MGAKRLMLVVVGVALAVTGLARAEALPFKQKTEVYRDRDGEVMVFALHLEQPFLAEEFESSSYLRLQPLGENAYLVYPKETKFRQKHAAFYGRLRRQGRAKLRLSYETVTENLIREIDGQEPKGAFDGPATCFIVSGYEKAVLIDFNYEVEPLPGMYPFPGVGPMTLLGESHANYWGKMMFKWVYWNMMLKGLELPLETQMTMAGKSRPAAAA